MKIDNVCLPYCYHYHRVTHSPLEDHCEKTSPHHGLTVNNRGKGEAFFQECHHNCGFTVSRERKQEIPDDMEKCTSCGRLVKKISGKGEPCCSQCFADKLIGK